MNRYLAEAIATFCLVFASAGAVLAGGGRIEIAAAYGLALLAMIYVISHISGAHMNPAVTVGMWVGKKISPTDAIGYIISQLFGAAVAGYVLFFAFGNPLSAVSSLAAGVSVEKAILFEAILTFLLVFTIFGMTIDRKASAEHTGMAAGAVTTFAVLVGYGVTGASLNPARFFGPALVSGAWANLIVYVAGPVIGAVAAVVFYQFVLMDKRSRR